MYEVASREMPQRSLLCLKRNVDESGAWAFGKEFIAIIRDQRLPRIPGREGAMFSIYWGQVSADTHLPIAQSTCSIDTGYFLGLRCRCR